MTNRAEMKLNAPKRQALLAEIEKKEGSINSIGSIDEEEVGQRSRTVEE